MYFYGHSYGNVYRKTEALSEQTKAHIERVESDGGVVLNPSLANDIINFANVQNDNPVLFCHPACGVKLDQRNGESYITKMYSLFNEGTTSDFVDPFQDQEMLQPKLNTETFEADYAGGKCFDSGRRHIGNTGFFADSTDSFRVYIAYRVPVSSVQETLISRAVTTASQRDFQIAFMRSTNTAATPRFRTRGAITNTDFQTDDNIYRLIDVSIHQGSGVARSNITTSINLNIGSASENTLTDLFIGSIANETTLFTGAMKTVALFDNNETNADIWANKIMEIDDL